MFFQPNIVYQTLDCLIFRLSKILIFWTPVTNNNLSSLANLSIGKKAKYLWEWPWRLKCTLTGLEVLAWLGCVTETTCSLRVENDALWFLKQPHYEAKRNGIYSV